MMAIVITIVLIAFGSAIGLAFMGVTNTAYQALPSTYTATTYGNSTASSQLGKAICNATGSYVFGDKVTLQPGLVYSISAYMNASGAGNNVVDFSLWTLSGVTATLVANYSSTIPLTTTLTGYTRAFSTPYEVKAAGDYLVSVTGHFDALTVYLQNDTTASSTGYAAVLGASPLAVAAWTGQDFKLYANENVYNGAGQAQVNLFSIIYSSWPLLGLAVLALIGGAVLAALLLFKG
jgi:hypothetical protein